MKRILALPTLFVLGLILITSCSQSLEGKWKLVSVNQNNINPDDFNEIVHFEKSNNGDGAGEITTIIAKGEPNSRAFTYSFEGKKLDVEEPDTAFNFTVKSLDEKSMTLVVFDTVELHYNKI